jgi:hypothetical protein
MSDRTENSINKEQSLNACNEQSPLVNADNLDKVPGQCGTSKLSGDDGTPSLKRVPNEIEEFFEDNPIKKTGVGVHDDCDPMMTGHIINDPHSTNRNVINKYSNSIRGADEAMLDMFRDLVVIDEDGKAHNVPVIWATQEKAVAAVLQDNVRKDNTLVVDRIKLPMLAIHQNDISFNQNRYTYHKARRIIRGPNMKPAFTIQEKALKDTVFGITRGIPVDISYTLYAWTLYLEDMNQIVEQIFLKFSPIAYINVRGVWWEIPVSMTSTGNNIDTEPGDQAIRVIKYQFNFTAESYIPQPITRDKAVLKMKLDFTDALEEEDITQVVDRIEETIKDLDAGN